MDALHGEVVIFSCPHCKVKQLYDDVDSLLKHMRLHGLLLYKCGYCSFIHHLKHKIEKHTDDTHPGMAAKVVMLRNIEAEYDNLHEPVPVLPPPPAAPKTRDWRCSLCKYRCAGDEDIKNHVLNKHEIDSQYKCALCTYKSNDKDTFQQHFADNHENQKIDIIYVYRKVEKDQKGLEIGSFDTTPLWRRARVRQIRGILLDEASKEEKPVKTPKKVVKPAPSKPAPSNLDLAIEAVVSGNSEVLKSKGLLETTEVKEAKNEPVKPVQKKEENEPAKPVEENEGDEPAKVVQVKEVDEPVIVIEDDEEESPKAAGSTSVTTSYGSFGAPYYKQFMCPSCSNFKTKLVPDFILHLYKEMKCKRFKCKICSSFSCVAYEFIESHIRNVHKMEPKPNQILELPRNKKLEQWVQLLLQSQSSAIIAKYGPMVSEIKVGGTKNLPCPYCTEMFSDLGHLHEHQLIHWSKQPYACPAEGCSRRGNKKELLEMHMSKDHPDLKKPLMVVGPVVHDVISGPRKPKQQVEEKLEEIIPLEDPPEDDEDEPLLEIRAIVDEPIRPVEVVMFTCDGCAFYTEFMSVIESHVKEHVGVTISYKKVRACDDGGKSNVACYYCAITGSDLTIREHHLLKHPELTYKPYKFICELCTEKFMDNKQIRTHFLRTHPNSEIRYRNLSNEVREQSKLGTRVFRCNRCTYSNTNTKTVCIRMHVRSHTKPVNCGLCKMRFPFMSQAKQHFAKKHPNEPLAVEDDEERMKETRTILGDIVRNAELLDFVPPSVKPPPVVKNIAKKSTSKPAQTVTTSDIYNDDQDQFVNIFDLCPEVQMETGNSELDGNNFDS